MKSIFFVLVTTCALAMTSLGALIAHYELDNHSTNSAPGAAGPDATLNGDAAYTAVSAIGSHAVAFDGTGDYVDLGDNFDVGTNDLTVMAWVKTSTKAFARIVSKEGAGGYNISLNATLGVGCTLDATYNYYYVKYEDGRWHHLAATFDRNGYAKVYWDGALLGSFDISAMDGSDLNNAAKLYFGWRSTGGSGAFNGSMDDVRIYDEALQPSDIQNIVNIGSLRFSFDGDTANSATEGIAIDGTLTGDAAFTNYCREGTQALTLDGDGDYVKYGSIFDMGTNDWTVACWMQTAKLRFMRLVSKRRWALATGSTGKLSMLIEGSGQGGGYQLCEFSLPAGTYYDNRFHHVAAVLKRDSTVTMYWDGQVIGSQDITTNAAANIWDTWPLIVGNRWNNGSPDAGFEGTMDDVRVYTEAKTAEFIREIAEYSFKARSAAHYSFDGTTYNVADDAMHPIGILLGDAGFTNSAHVGSHALALDGSGDYVNLGEAFDVGTNDLTVAAWIKTANKTFARIVSKEGAGGYNISLHATAGVGCTLDDTTQYFNAAYEDGKWHHLAATFDRDDVATVYFDGNLLGSFDISSLDSVDLDNQSSLCVGWRSTGGSGAFNGFIDDVHLFGRVLTQEEIKGLFPPPKGTLIRVQ